MNCVSKNIFATAGALTAALVLLAGCAATSPRAVSLAGAEPVPPLIPMRDFFRDAERGSYRLSADGRMLGFMQPAAGADGNTKRLNLFVQPLQGGKLAGEPKQLTFETARDIADYDWKGGGTLLYAKDFGGDENFHVVAVDAASGTVTDLTPFVGVRASVLDPLPDDPSHILVQHNQRDKSVFDVFRIDVRTGAQTLVAQNPGNIAGWQTDHTGALRLAVASDGVNNTLLYRATEAEPFKALFTTDFRTAVTPQFFDAQNQKFYAVSNRGRDKSALVLIDPKAEPARPETEQLVFASEQVDLDSATWSRARKTLGCVDYIVDKPERKCFDAEMQSTFERLRSKLPGYTLTLQSETLAQDLFVVAASNDRSDGSRYLYDSRSDSLTLLGALSPWLQEAQMAPMQPIHYTARDGVRIPGYLTLPVGRQAKLLPCVVNPHGGPWARDGWHFRREVQFLANRGYCVLQMNFRGSTGFGRAFWERSFKQWGLAMQDDVTDGVAWLVQQGIADPKRVAIYGGSYGGYATLAGIVKTPDLYAAAIDYVGVSNLFTFMKTFPPYWEPFRQQMYAMVGNPEDPADQALLAANSPALHVDRIRTPLLVVQGARDPRVNKAESDQIVQALRARGVEVEYLVKDNEGHGFANEENRFDFYNAMEAFLGRHLKP